MNIPILVATGLMALTWIAHVFGGGPEINAPLQASDLPDYLRAMSGVLWHMATTCLTVFFFALAWLVRHPNAALTWVLSLVQLGWAGLFIYYGASQLGSLWPMPQWSVFLLIPALTLWGEWRRGSAT